MLQGTVFQQKTEELSKDQCIGSFVGCDFEANNDFSVSRKIIELANARLDRITSISNGTSLSDEVGWLTHSQIELGEELGKGTYHCVYAVKSLRSPRGKIHDSEEIVIKILRRSLMENPSRIAHAAADMVKEGLILASMRHPHIISVQAWTPTGLSGFQNGRHDAFFLVLDRFDTTIRRKLEQWKKYSMTRRLILDAPKRVTFLEERLKVLSETADALKYIHSRHILHRDLKPDNIGIDYSGRVKVFDFDMARALPNSAGPNECLLLTGKVGAPRYMSPECGRSEPYNLKADVYSFALLCHQVYSLSTPFSDFPPKQHAKLVFYDGSRPGLPKSWPGAFRSLLHNSWSNTISERPTMEKFYSILEEQIPELLKVERSISGSISSFASFLWPLARDKSSRSRK